MPLRTVHNRDRLQLKAEVINEHNAMTPISELEEQLVQLPPSEKLHLIEVLARSLDGFWHADSELATEDLDLVSFFQRSPLAEAIAGVAASVCLLSAFLLAFPPSRSKGPVAS